MIKYSADAGYTPEENQFADDKFRKLNKEI